MTYYPFAYSQWEAMLGIFDRIVFSNVAFASNLYMTAKGWFILMVYRRHVSWETHPIRLISFVFSATHEYC